MTIFQKIIDKQIPSHIVYEDDDVLAFLDLAQYTKGHTLVIPKVASENFLDTSPEVLTKVMMVTQKLAIQIKSKLGASGINILSNAGEAADQGVMHFHMHIIPRYDETDEFKINFNQHSDINLKLLLSKIKGE